MILRAIAGHQQQEQHDQQQPNNNNNGGDPNVYDADFTDVDGKN